MLAATDTGIGMDMETQARMFEPFFTTKPQGEGTGLGLSVVHGIIKQSGGSIFVYSEPGVGTSFKIYLPRVSAPALPETRSPSENSSTQAGTEAIVVVEDEASLRALAERVLRAAGYEVHSYPSADEALEALWDCELPADLLLTDVVLPGVLQGKDLADLVEGFQPDLVVLYMAGYTRNAIVHQGRLDEEVNFLEQPFSPEGLTHAVRAVCEAG